MIRSAMALLIATAALVAFAPQAAAVKPESESFHLEFPGEVVASCTSFDMMEDSIYDIRVTTYFNKDGDPIRAKVHVVFKSTLYNSVEPDKSFTDQAAWTDIEDLEVGTVKTVGAVFHTTIPGEGLVARYIGNIVFDGVTVVFEAGQHPEPDFDAIYASLCPYFA